VPDFTKSLGKSLTKGHQRVQQFVRVRDDHVRQLVGRWYDSIGASNLRAAAESQKTSEQRMVVNLLMQAVQSMVPAIMGDNVMPHVTPSRAGLQAEAELIQTMLEHWQVETNMEAVWEQIAVCAILQPFVPVEVSLRAGNEITAIDGAIYDIGQPFAALVDLDTYAMDPEAENHQEKRWDATQLIISREGALASGLYDPAVIENAPSLKELRGNKRNSDPGDEELEERIVLWKVNVYGSRETIIHTLCPDSSGSGEILGDNPKVARPEYTFEGPEGSPIHILECGIHAPGLPFGAAPIAALRDVHDSMCKIAARTVSQLMRSKRLPVYKKARKDDFLKAMEAQDGDGLGINDPSDINVLDLGGVDPTLYTGMDWFGSVFNDQGAGLMTRSGARSPAKTATSASILQANSDLILSRMARRFRSFAGGVYRGIGWYFLTDPYMQKPLPYRLPGGEMVEVVYSAETKEGDHADFMFSMLATNGPRMDPAVRAARTVEFIAQLPTIVQTLAMLGVPPLPAIKALARDIGINNMAEILPGSEVPIAIQAAPPIGAAPAGQQTGPASSSRRIDQVRSAAAPSVPTGYGA